MPEDREKLLKIMNSLDADYREGRISAEKYSYFRSKYEDRLNDIDAKLATKRIRSMQGKPSGAKSNKLRSKNPTKAKSKEKEDLVQKYIINPKKEDNSYKKKEQMDNGTFSLLLVLILVVGFTVGVGCGIFAFDFDSVTSSNAVAIVDDTAFPEFTKNINTTNQTSYSSSNNSNYGSSSNVVSTSYSSSDSSSSSSQQSGGSSSDSGSGSQDSGGGSNDGKSDSGNSGSGDNVKVVNLWRNY